MSGRFLKWIGMTVFAATVSGLGLYLLTRDKLEEADQSASVIGAFIGLGSLALTLYGMLADRGTRSASTPVNPEETIVAAKKALTGLVARQWRTEATIRALDDPEPIPITWHLVDDAATMDHPRLVGEHLWTFTGSSDRIPELADAFRRLRRRRLVITGSPGTGKTTLAIQLLQHLVAPGHDAADPVPVLVPVNGWNTTTHPRLHDWLAARLPLDYPALTAPRFGTAAAQALLDHGHILPILDGLDEIPDHARTQVIRALNRWLAEGDSFILTSRTTEYDQAVKQAGDVLNAAAVIAPAPITAADAETYLRACLPPAPRHDWTPIWAALHNATHPGLSRLAETALGLWLIRTVHITPATDPIPLTGPPAQQETTLRAHLFDHLIPAAIDSRPPSSDPAEHFRPRTAWNPDHTRDHLTYLARLLHHHNTYDLAWWQLAQHTVPPAGRRRTVRRAVLVVGLTGGLMAALGLPGGFGLAFGLMAGLVIRRRGGLVFGLTGVLVGSLAFGLEFGLVGVLAIGFAVGRGTWFTETPGYADLHLSGRTTDLIKNVRNALAKWLAVGFAFGLAFGFMDGLMDGLMNGLVFGLAFGLLVGLAVGLAVGSADGVIKWAEQPASSTIATTPLTSWKADRTLTLLRVITLGLGVGLGLGLLAGLMSGPMGGITFGITLGLTFGLTLGNHHAWLAYTIAARRLAKKGHLPRKLMAFLDDAHRLGLLRTVGPVYQFRHAELQDHLAAPPSPSSEPTGTTTTPRSTENAS
ncbi:NACHT domain-containing protein [Streptosporangium sp. NBC_01495]|uniref:NACHT domain-containing protein n=1 Tax=Streptosporangium sp. NBC_01495 TaxID=2903899 RepID=UPI002E2ECF49|nr:NACHT domain-containing protein [Streptosporangium sp. NBC_01495]